ncbi:hypothetical protein RCC89_18915 [Cytophagaceae bacterium ABcell3]|nr:hypothetical protein RCC89_18915 [Cytophagaceae bacterium ABcell3]
MDRNRGNKSSPELSAIWINQEGKLCEMFRMGDAVVNRLFNCVKWNWDGSLKLSFNPEFITQAGW